MSTQQHTRPVIGVWNEWHGHGDPRAEGVARLLGFLVEGAAESKACTFRIVIPDHIAPLMHEMLAELNATEGEDWILEPMGEAGLETDPADPAPPPFATSEVEQAFERLREAQLRLAQERAPPLAEDDAESAESQRQALERAEGERVREAEVVDQAFADLARTVGAAVAVDGWLVLFPFHSAGALLPGPRAVLFADAIPYEFPLGWPEDAWAPGAPLERWATKTRFMLAQGDAVITFSDHVAERHAGGFFNVAKDRTRVVPHAAPRSDHLLPFLPPDGRRTRASQVAAADLLRRHIAVSENVYLQDFPFEDVRYLVVSTQDRPNKNINLAVEAVRRLIKRDRTDLKLILTAPMGGPTSFRYDQLEAMGLQHDVLSVPLLPPAVHAALMHAAELVVHPSVFEGGRAPFPLTEAVSVGTPCIIGDGPHTREFQLYHDVGDVVFDPYDAEGLVRMIKSALADRAGLLQKQSRLLAEISRRTWGQVAAEYADAVLGGNTGRP
jgi:glycosyltransferase involved in cell wall biosynthesis